MPSILTKPYRTVLTEQFQSIVSSTTAVYVFVGRPQDWVDTANGSVNDSNPPVPNASFQMVDFTCWRDMLGAKRLAAANTSLVVRRIDWSANTVYTQYDDTDGELFTPTLKSFYVLDSTDNPIKVYKCLWNASGANSTIAPSSIGTNVNPQTTADGYVWQYMYSIPSTSYKFLTNAWMPIIVDANVVTNATTYPGRLPTAVPLLVTNGGASYNAAATRTVTIIGDGSGATGVSGGVTIVGGAVTAVVLANGGLGYSQVTTANVYQSGSTPATVRVIIPPYPNHGADASKELGCSSVMVNTQLEYSESGELTTINNYRRIGLLLAPNLANGSVANASFLKQTYDVTISANTGTLGPDDVVVNSTKTTHPTATVVDVIRNDANTAYVVRLTNVNPMGETTPFATSDVLHCTLSGVEVTANTVSAPELQPFSGRILYIDQRTPVTRSIDQIEEIRLIYQIG